MYNASWPDSSILSQKLNNQLLVPINQHVERIFRLSFHKCQISVTPESTVKSTTTDIRMTPQTVDELKVAAEIMQYHSLHSHQKQLGFHIRPSCELNNELK